MTRRLGYRVTLVLMGALIQAVLTISMWGMAQGALDSEGPRSVPSTLRWSVAILSFPLGYLPQAWLGALQLLIGDPMFLLGLLGLNALIWGVCVVGGVSWLGARVRATRG